MADCCCRCICCGNDSDRCNSGNCNCDHCYGGACTDGKCGNCNSRCDCCGDTCCSGGCYPGHDHGHCFTLFCMFSDCCNSNPGVGLLPGNSGGHSTIINGDQLTNTGSTSQNIQSQRESKGSDVITAQPLISSEALSMDPPVVEQPH